MSRTPQAGSLPADSLPIRRFPTHSLPAGRRPLAALALAGLVVATPAVAQQGALTFLDLLSPDRIAARMLQVGLVSLRTQLDLTYEDVSVSVLEGSATLTDVVMSPPVAMRLPEGCRLTFDRVTLQTTPMSDLDTVRARLQATGGNVTGACAADGAQMMQTLGIDHLALSRVTLDATYRISSSALTFHAFARADDLAAVSADVDLAYFAVKGPDGFNDFLPVAVLKSARLLVENLGAWEKVKPMLPPPVTDPAQADAMVTSFLDGVLGETDPGEAPSKTRTALTDLLGSAWSGFLADPRQVVFETGFPADTPKPLALPEWKSDPDRIIADLEPHAGSVPAPVRALLPTTLLKAAYDSPDGLADDERVQVGIALATGEGAPRDLATAAKLLEAAVADGDGAATLALARALETRDPEKAYTLALQAAATGEAGAAGTLDRLEAALPFAAVLARQAELVAGLDQPVEALASIASVRAEASMRMTGNGRTRSYATAEIWALIGAAAGDPESADILADIDRKVRAGGIAAAPVWADQEARATELARNAWTGFDLPARYGHTD